MKPIYLDHAASTPVAPEVRAAMEPWLAEEFANPSSRHPAGVRAAEAIDRARAQVARALGARAAQVVFTSGGTEANNLAVLGVARAAARNGRHVLIGPTEHASVRAPAMALREEGFEVEVAHLDADGSLDLEDVATRLRPDTVLVAQMLASNEVGTVYPVRELARLVRARSPAAALLVDAVQAFGKLDCSPAELGADAVSVSGHKVHGPKGAGALVLARDLPLRPLAFGGGQERGLRPGTPNVAGIVGLGAAAELAAAREESTRAALRAAREAFEQALAELPGVRILRPGSARTPPLDSIVGLLVPGAPAEVCMHHLEARGVFVSAGSACQASKKELSPALLALGLAPEEARRFLRVSFSRETTPQEVRRAARVLAEVGAALGAAR